jgi:hypothetical protein
LNPLLEPFTQLEKRVSLHKAMLALEGVAYRPEHAHAALSSWMLSHWFFRRVGAAPKGGRASGDSGWVAHLQSLTRGAAGWEPGYTLVRAGESDGVTGRRGQWAFVSDGRLSLFLDEPGQYSPPAARPGERVAVRVPRARENLYPHRFTLLGNQGAAPPGEPMVKLFVAGTLEGAAQLVASLSGRSADGLRFSLFLGNEPRDFQRTDNIVLDVAARDEAASLKLISEFFRGQPARLLPLPAPLQSQAMFPGVARAAGSGREDAADGFLRRRADQLAAVVLDALYAGELTAAQWLARLG